MPLRVTCLERLIDPKTKKAVAAYDWLRRDRGLPDQYWVSIGNRPPEFFSTEELAKQFYKDSIVSLLARLRLRGLRGYGNKLAQAASTGK
jgi:hypothetical protein